MSVAPNQSNKTQGLQAQRAASLQPHAGQLKGGGDVPDKLKRQGGASPWFFLSIRHHLPRPLWFWYLQIR